MHRLAPARNPGPGTVDVWWIDLASVAEETLAVLSSEERARAERLRRPRDRWRWSRARAALRAILAGYAGLAAESLSLVADSRGKPALAGGSPLRFSLSHAGERAALAVTWECEVGIDLEPIDAGLDVAPLLPVACAPTERTRLAALPAAERPAAFLRLWTLREAYLKATGAGFARDPRQIRLDVLRDGRVTIDEPFATGDEQQWWLGALDADPGWVASMAVAGAAPGVRAYRWSGSGARDIVPCAVHSEAEPDMQHARQALITDASTGHALAPE